MGDITVLLLDSKLLIISKFCSQFFSLSPFSKLYLEHCSMNKTIAVVIKMIHTTESLENVVPCGLASYKHVADVLR